MGGEDKKEEDTDLPFPRPTSAEAGTALYGSQRLVGPGDLGGHSL